MATIDDNGAHHSVATGKYATKPATENDGGTSDPTMGPVLVVPPAADLALTDNDTFAPLNVRMVFPGDKYGRDDVLTHNGDEPLVEFYDARYPFTEHGQFVSRYYLSTLKEGPARGLNLDGGIPAWSVTPENMVEVLDWTDDRIGNQYGGIDLVHMNVDQNHESALREAAGMLDEAGIRGELSGDGHGHSVLTDSDITYGRTDITLETDGIAVDGEMSWVDGQVDSITFDHGPLRRRADRSTEKDFTPPQKLAAQFERALQFEKDRKK